MVAVLEQELTNSNPIIDEVLDDLFGVGKESQQREKTKAFCIRIVADLDGNIEKGCLNCMASCYSHGLEDKPNNATLAR